MFAPFRETGLPVIMHSDGQIQTILPDLIEIGLTALNPVQPEVLDHIWLAEKPSETNWLIMVASLLRQYCPKGHRKKLPKLRKIVFTI